MIWQNWNQSATYRRVSFNFQFMLIERKYLHWWEKFDQLFFLINFRISVFFYNVSGDLYLQRNHCENRGYYMTGEYLSLEMSVFFFAQRYLLSIFSEISLYISFVICYIFNFRYRYQTKQTKVLISGQTKWTKVLISYHGFMTTT